jgi:polyisoprenoid-binding protein YceI
MTTLEMGPAHGTLTLHTGVEGRAARIGHALTIAMGSWRAIVTLDGVEPTAVTLQVSLASLQVVRGDGVLPLTPLDKRKIRSGALTSLAAAAHPCLDFTSTSVAQHAGGYEVRGEVALAGKTGPLGVAVTVARAEGLVTCDASFPFVQTAFGITPYSAMLGALRVSDAVEVRLSVSFPDPAG